jgi:myo-inositol-1(or 4)-monophosphatase
MSTLTARPEALEADWLGASRRATDALRRILDEAPTSRERVEETGNRGEGGDQTLIIDQGAEDAVFAELEKLHDGGARFSALSEERGMVDFGSEDVLVVIDPIDGSMNAKRGLTHHAISIGVAAGNTMGDMEFGYVFDFGPDEEWVARRGEGVLLNGAPLPDPPPPRHNHGKLELVAIESADPRWIAKGMDELLEHVHRIRAMGTIAVSLCQVALTRVDGMATMWKTRSVDAAAAQLIVRESGGVVAFPGCESPLASPLDLEPNGPIVAARTEEDLDRLAAVVSHSS